MRLVLAHLRQRHSIHLLVGVGLFLLMAIGGALYAQVLDLPLLPWIVTWEEWAVAILLLPHAISAGLGIVRRDHGESGRASRLTGLVSQLGWIALVIFLLDLLTRAIFGLGYKPF